jgi:inositol hexakisphosphate/diphosphoinositol-pentakisphosphate kinase
MHTLVNLVLLSGLPIANRRIPELDFAVGCLPGSLSLCCTYTLLSVTFHVRNIGSLQNLRIDCLIFSFELYERNYGRGKTDKEYSIKLSISEGAHSPNVLDSTLDAKHSLNVRPRRCFDFKLTRCPDQFTHIFSRKLTQHLPYGLVIEKLSKHFGRLSSVRCLK